MSRAAMMRAGRRHPEVTGVVYALVSATAFGATTIIGKLAYREGVNVPTLLAVRFTLGASMLWALTFVVKAPRSLTRRQIVVFLVLGGVGYALQSRLFFEALSRIPAASAGLLLYAYPAIVALFALALGRDRMSAGKAVALVLGLVGTALVLGAPTGGLDGLGAGLAISSATAYAVYILVAERAISGVHPLVASATIVTGGAISFSITGFATGRIDLSVGGAGWAWLALLGFVSITVAVSTFLAAVDRIGPTRASIASTWEPVVTVILASIALDERLAALQLLGGAFVVAAVATLPIAGRARASLGEMPVEAER